MVLEGWEGVVGEEGLLLLWEEGTVVIGHVHVGGEGVARL